MKSARDDLLTRMMRLHSLKGMHEESPSFEINFSSFGDDTTLGLTSRPKSMPHGTPWILRISAKITLSVPPNVESGRRPSDCQVDDARFIGGRLDGV